MHNVYICTWECISYVYSAYSGWEKVLDLLELELKEVMSYLVYVWELHSNLLEERVPLITKPPI